MNDVNFHVETIKRSVDAIAKMDLNSKEISEAMMELMQHPNFQTLFNVKLQSKVIHERELCELIGLKRGSLDIAEHVFQFNDDWGVSKEGVFSVDTYSRNESGSFYRGQPIRTFIFRIVEANDGMSVSSGIRTFVIGIMKPGEDIVYKVQFVTHNDLVSKTMVDILARLAPDFKVFATKL